MLGVTVDLNSGIVIVVSGITESRLNGSANPEVKGQPHNLGARFLGFLSRVVLRPVIDDQDMLEGVEAADFRNKRADSLGFIQSRNDDQCFFCHE